MTRKSKIVLTGLLAVVIAAGVGVWAEAPAIASAVASRALGRRVSIGAVHLSPGRWFGVAVSDVRVANLPGGSRPDMATLTRASGEIALPPLLHGEIVARSVRVENGDILLEHVEGQPNWRSGPKRPPQPGGGRDRFPTLLGADVTGVIALRTTSGHVLTTRLDGVRIEAASAAAPARVAGPGAYEGVPIAIDLKLGSYDQLHDAQLPFPTDVTLSSGDTVLHFVGTMTDPLNVDGAKGQLSVVAPTPAVLEKVSDAGSAPAPALKLEGAFEHQDPLWAMQQARGALGEAPLEDGTLRFKEGDGAATPDQADLDLRFGTVDADRLVAAFGGGSGGGPGGSFAPAADPNPLVTAKLAAAEIRYGGVDLPKLSLSLQVAPKLLTLEAGSAGGLGGQIRLQGRLRASDDGKTGNLDATGTATGIDVSQLSEMSGAGRLPLVGRMDVHAAAAGRGSTTAAALQGGSASVVATMQGGSVSARWVELAATDVAGLLKSSHAMVPLGCLLAVAEVRGGVAELGPVRVRSAQGTIVARGQVDLARDTLDLVVASEAHTTGALALDVPLRVSGRLSDPSVAPAGAAAGQRALADRSLGGLAPPLRDAAQRSACAR